MKEKTKEAIVAMVFGLVCGVMVLFALVYGG
jgi:hypothetical protein